MNKPTFSIVALSRNEVKHIPRLLASLKEFFDRGGEFILVDTGSTDGTPDVARSLGATVHEVGDMFLVKVDQEMADKINNHFVVEGEEPLLKVGDRIFDFASARNHAAFLASNNMISNADCDEEFTKLDIDAIEAELAAGWNQFEYEFVFSHDQYGNPAIHFRQSKFYDKTCVKWVGVTHEVLQGPARIKYLDQSIFKLEHWQNLETNRSNYLRGLAVDCYQNPGNDRNSHYLGREMVWCGRPKSAIKELKKHVAMDRWPAEAAQSMLFIGDAYGNMGDIPSMLEWYHKSIAKEGNRREAWMRLAWYYYKTQDAQRAACYAGAALQIPWSDFYANQHGHYTNEPHEILYWALWYLGDKEGSKYHFKKALEYMPANPKYLADKQFYDS